MRSRLRPFAQPEIQMSLPPTTHQIGCHRREAVEMTFSPSVLDPRASGFAQSAGGVEDRKGSPRDRHRPQMR